MDFDKINPRNKPNKIIAKQAKKAKAKTRPKQAIKINVTSQKHKRRSQPPEKTQIKGISLMIFYEYWISLGEWSINIKIIAMDKYRIF